MARSKQRSKYNHDELEHIREDLDSLRNNVVALSKSLRNDAKESAVSGWNQVKRRSNESLVQVEEQVKEHPARSVLTAFGAGLILSALLRRH